MTNLATAYKGRANVARSTLQLIERGSARRVALYLMPSGEVLRVANPKLRDEDITDALIGVYDATATEDDIVADILATAAA